MISTLLLRYRTKQAFILVLLAISSLIEVSAGGVIIGAEINNPTSWAAFFAFPLILTFTFAIGAGVLGISLMVRHRGGNRETDPSTRLTSVPDSLMISSENQGEQNQKNAVLVLLMVVFYMSTNTSLLFATEPDLFGQLADNISHPDTLFALPAYILAGEIFLVFLIIATIFFVLSQFAARISIEQPIVTIDATGIMIASNQYPVHLNWATMLSLSVKHMDVDLTHSAMNVQNRRHLMYDVFHFQDHMFDLRLHIKPNPDAESDQSVAQTLRTLCNVYSPLPLRVEQPTILSRNSIGSFDSATLIPTPTDLVDVEAVQLPLALRPRLPWIRMISPMVLGTYLGAPIANLWMLRVTSLDVFGAYYKAFQPPFFNPFLIPPDLRPPFWWLAFGLQIALGFFSLIALPIVSYYAQPKITASAKGFSIKHIGKRQFAHWHEIASWTLTWNAQGNITGSMMTYEGRKLTWVEFPNRGVSRAVIGRKASNTKDAFQQQSRRIHALIMLQTHMPPNVESI